MLPNLKDKLMHFVSNKNERNIFRNMAKLVAGDGIARVIGITTTPIITRIYLPEQMGVLTVFVSLLALMAPFATLRYSVAIPLPKNDRLSFNLLALSFIILSCITIIICAIYSFIGKQTLNLFSVPQIDNYWWLIPVSFWSIGLYEILSQWAVRKKQFSALAKTKVTQKLIGSLTKIGLGLCGLKPLGLLVGEIFTQMGGVLSLFRTFVKDFRYNMVYIKKSTIRFLCFYFIDFPKYRLPSQFFLIFSGKVPLLYFAWKYGTEATGQLGLSITMLSIPVTLIGGSVGKTFYAEIATIGKKEPNKIFKLTKNIMQKLFGFSFIPFLIILFLGPWIFKLFFGDMWLQAGIYAQILSFYLLFQFVYSPISDGVINVFNKQNVVFLIEFIRIIIVVAIFSIAYLLQLCITFTLISYSIGLTIHYCIATYIILRIIRLEK